MEQEGLTEVKASEKLAKFGPNKLPEAPFPSDLKIFFSQFKSPLIYILFFAALVTIFLKNFSDTIVILFAVFLNTIFGFYQERKAERALFALQKVLTPHARVIREGKIKIIEIPLLVPGDLVILSQGDKVPADGIVVEAVNLTVNEAILTGESIPVAKKAAEVGHENQVFMGTTVVSGRGKILVTKTGPRTKIGKIATRLKTLEEEKTPLQKRISSLARSLAILVGGICGAIFLTGVLMEKNALEMFTTSCAIAVAAIPEGMAPSLTVILAIGMERILRRKALVRKLLAAEVLGSVSLIATDKTGTLTEGRLKVVKKDFTNKKLAYLALVLLNNQADPLEIALWQWAEEKLKICKIEKIIKENPRVAEIPFDPEKKYQIVVTKLKIESQNSNFEESKREKYQLFVSGGPEIILSKCKLPDGEKRKWREKIEKWGKEELRMIGLGYKFLGEKKGSFEEARDLVWLGLFGFEDPIREGVREALKACNKAGIKVKLITGDYPETASAVWRKITSKKAKDIVGSEIEKIPFEKLKEEVKEVDIFSRVSPAQKLKIVEALKENGEVVALIGDGVNDVLALKRADIGIVVGGAQDMAKEIADIVLLDSNFSTILAAIEEGRGIFENIKKVILYLLSDSFSEVLLVLGSLIFALPLPLTPAQILYINLLTDGFPNLALTLEPKEKDLLKRKPIKIKAPLVTSEGKLLIALISLLTAIFCLLIFTFFLKKEGTNLARTVVFVALGIDSLFYAFSIRNLGKSILSLDLFSNPYLLLAFAAGISLQILPLYQPFLQKILLTTQLNFNHWLLILTNSFFVIILIEVVKRLWKHL